MQTKRELVYMTLGRIAAEKGSVQGCDVIEALGGNVIMASNERGRWLTIFQVTKALVKDGHLEATGRPVYPGYRSDIIYRLTERGAMAFAAAQAGRPIPAAVSPRPTWNRQLWASARIMRRFTLTDLLRTLDDVPRDRAAKYVRRLEKAGAVVQERRVSLGAGVGGNQIVYRVVRDNGPEPPVAIGPTGHRTSTKSPAGEVKRG